MTTTDAIVAEGISKTFRLSRDPVHTVKERLLRFGRTEHDDFIALHPLDLRIETGETVGLLGHNGSGKSTLLKCIAGILTPTTGQIRIRGRLASLLELGAGFHPELTGRENVYINAAFLGLRRKEIEKRFDDIVEFAELQQFIDEPVKHYSSGMYVRLGFAVSVNLDPDVLLVDEVLAVGDEVFQTKCLNRVREFQEEGRTIVVVTHAADLVRQVCTRGIVLHHGHLVADAAPGQAIRIYREHLHGQLTDIEQSTEAPEGPVHIERVEVCRTQGTDRAYLVPGEPVQLSIHYLATEPVHDARLAVEILDRDGRVMHATDTDALGTPLGTLDGAGVVRWQIARVPLLDGSYHLNIRLLDRSHGHVLALRQGIDHFEVMQPGRASGVVALDVSVEHERNKEH